MAYIVLLLTSLLIFFAQVPDASQNRIDLQLKTEIMEQTVCQDIDSIILHLKLKLIYANIGNRALILSKTSSIIIRDRVAKTKEDLAEKNYEVDARYEWALAGEGNLKEWDHPDEYDVIIAPGESFETTDEIRLPLISVTVRKEKIKELTDGEHYLQIVVSPWQSPPKGETLRERWKKYGDFWYESITSEPMLINVEKPKKVHRCSNG